MIEYRIQKRLHTIGGPDVLMGMWSSSVPSYWIAFDGSNDYIDLPAGEGSEPSTALFVEAWFKDIALTDFLQGAVVMRGQSAFTGYTAGINTGVGGDATLALNLDNGAGNSTNGAIGISLFDNAYGVHLAWGWDGATKYFFVQGRLLAIVASVTGTLEYTGTNWRIGTLANGTTWPLNAKMSMMRISNTCRHTSSFIPARHYTSDANTVALFMAEEGSGTSLVDSGPGAHHGTFKASGEPAWSTEVELGDLTRGEAMWEAVNEVLPVVSGGDIWMKRISADEYHLFKKVNETGPYWAKFVLARNGGITSLVLSKIYTGVPTASGADPDDWTVDPALLLIDGLANEYVFNGRMEDGGTMAQWGSGHGGDTLDSEGFTVDGTPTTLSNGQWVSGDEIIYTAATHCNDTVLATTFVNVTKSLTLNTTDMWMTASYQFDWLEDYVFTSTYALMMMMTTALPSMTIIPGGTDYTTSVTSGKLRAHAVAAWNASNEAIVSFWIDPYDGLRYATKPGCYLNGGLRKFYFERTNEINGALADTSWSYTCRWLALDGCGNHFLKTT